MGQSVEKYSPGGQWGDPEYFIGDEVSFRYDANKPDNFALDHELSNANFYLEVGITLLFTGIIGITLLNVKHFIK